MTNPCCCNLQMGVEAIGIYQIVSSVFGILFGVLLIVFNPKVRNANEVEVINQETVKFIAQFIGFGIGICLGILLVIGAKNKNHRHCEIWFWIQTVLLLNLVIILILAFAVGDTVSAVSWVIAILVQLYFMFCVYCFVQELKA